MQRGAVRSEQRGLRRVRRRVLLSTSVAFSAATASPAPVMAPAPLPLPPRSAPSASSPSLPPSPSFTRRNRRRSCAEHAASSRTATVASSRDSLLVLAYKTGPPRPNACCGPPPRSSTPLELMATKPYPPHSTTRWRAEKDFAFSSHSPVLVCTWGDRGEIRSRSERDDQGEATGVGGAFTCTNVLPQRRSIHMHKGREAAHAKGSGALTCTN